MNDKSIISVAINGHPGDCTIKLTIIEYEIISAIMNQVNTIRIESCELLLTSAEVIMSKCMAITDDPSGGGIIK